MAIQYSPQVGQILMCDFKGMKEPEMVKRRPVIVTRSSRKGPKLVQIACLSTAKPEPTLNHHMHIEDKFLPRDDFFQGKETWLKGDMLYTVSFDRLDYIRLGRDNQKRIYFKQSLSRENMRKVLSCVLHGMNLGHLCEHL
ncbi:type II toxin-antitoxin system PemK/MazF family toxin [Enterovibrio sp. 27052020O]|uniref:type II toxin-antitoxin system PemK/MazF family toxin n=1 Tax=Enterovibrio sp. 27052020O TaxID=3241166 RepID=UPI00389083D1